MYIRSNPAFESFEALWQNGYASPFFTQTADPASEQVDWSLSERQLLVQSNGRAMLGQDTRGRLHFVCSPHENVYAIPSGGPDVGGQFRGHIGQYYQTDVALLLGKMRYEMELENGLLLDATGEDAKSVYLEHFMPLTVTSRPGMETRVFSLAPVLEKESVSLSDLHPLPGPSGALYGVWLKNTGGVTLRGKMHLRLEERFVNQFEHYGKRFEDYAAPPATAEWDNRLLVLWHPEACATIQLMDGHTGGDAVCPEMYIPFELAPGEARLFSTTVSVTPERQEAYAALGTLYRHTPLEWVNITAGFWAERFGKLDMTVDGDKEAGQKYRDMHLRFVLDNFNCLQFDKTGRMLTSWQGAPSHCLGRSWGIDMEPNVLAVLWAVPEIGRSAAEYTARYNLPGYSVYSDHSMLIALAPMVIAGKYLELTGDAAFFRGNTDLTDRLHGLYRYMLRHKHPQKALFSSHYGSDLPVFRRYDYGTNVKCVYALNYYADILKALEMDDAEPRALAKAAVADMAACMEGDGPFGRQITGGTNLGPTEGFYISEDVFYYGGEDSATCLAPVYGLYDFDYEPFVNLNRYARSLLITNYDPEYQTMRELHYGMNPSATGITLRLGGSLTKKEMAKSLSILFDRLDESGSLFWWPRSSNKKRCLTRCSQGQGAWVQQSQEQWLGLRMDAASSTLTVRPQGLLSAYSMKKGHVGGGVFTVQWSEDERETSFRIVNHGDKAVTLRLAARAFGAGAQGPLRWHEEVLPAGGECSKTFPAVAAATVECDVCAKEVELCAKDGAVFGPYGIVMPKLYGRNCDIFLLRYALVNGTGEAWQNTEVELALPDGWLAAPKAFYEWDYAPVFGESTAIVRLGTVQPGKHYVAPFFVAMPAEYAGGEKSVMLSRHPFRVPGGDENVPLELLVEAPQTAHGASITAWMRYDGGENTHVLPVRMLVQDEYKARYDQMLHGQG